MISDLISVFAVRVLAAMPWKVSQGIAELIGYCLAIAPFAKPHRIARINISICFPHLSESEQKALVRCSMIMLAKSIVAGAVSWIAPKEEMRKKISRVQGEGILNTALASGKPVIFISPHLGCWELINYYLCSRFELTILAKSFGGSNLNSMIARGRCRLKGTVVPTSERGVRLLVKALKQGGMTYITPDHVPKDGGGVFAPFFGVSTTTGTLTSRLIQSTGAQALAVTCTFLADDTFLLTFSSVDDKLYSADLVESVAGLNRTIETCILQAPEQYQWAYRRYKKVLNAAAPY